MPFFAKSALSLHLMSFGDAPVDYMHLRNWNYVKQQEANFTTKYPHGPRLDDSFFMTSETRPKPSVWRFIAWTIDFREKTAKTFWDGRHASTVQLSDILSFQSFEDVDEMSQPFPAFNPSILSTMFSGTKFYLDTLTESFDTLEHAWENKVSIHIYIYIIYKQEYFRTHDYTHRWKPSHPCPRSSTTILCAKVFKTSQMRFFFQVGRARERERCIQVQRYKCIERKCCHYIVVQTFYCISCDTLLLSSICTTLLVKEGQYVYRYLCDM